VVDYSDSEQRVDKYLHGGQRKKDKHKYADNICTVKRKEQKYSLNIDGKMPYE